MNRVCDYLMIEKGRNEGVGGGNDIRNENRNEIESEK